MINTLNIEDFLQTKEYHKINKNDMAKMKPFDTQILAVDQSGNPLFTTKNMIILSGALFFLSKGFNINYPISPATINSDLSVNASETAPGFTGLRREDFINSFSVGIGGSSLTFGDVKAVRYRDKNVDTMIPFRLVPTTADLSSGDRAKYNMKRTESTNFAYYLKKFENNPTLKCEFEDGTNVPANVHTISDSRIINTYMEILMKIGKDDCREYFELVNGDISQCRINSIGLCNGYYEDIGGGVLDIKGTRNVTKFNFNNESLDNYEKEINIIYKIFI